MDSDLAAVILPNDSTIVADWGIHAAKTDTDRALIALLKAAESCILGVADLDAIADAKIGYEAMARGASDFSVLVAALPNRSAAQAIIDTLYYYPKMHSIAHPALLAESQTRLYWHTIRRDYP